ncbi:hypothetical protein C8J57DRAFT_1227103 [Mycena rebaudengoi]|nr:hypothetical protein C8J57DRAFT_1227103 [Mycena rebaudengoi]
MVPVGKNLTLLMRIILLAAAASSASGLRSFRVTTPRTKTNLVGEECEINSANELSEGANFFASNNFHEDGGMITDAGQRPETGRSTSESIHFFDPWTRKENYPYSNAREQDAYELRPKFHILVRWQFGWR